MTAVRWTGRRSLTILLALALLGAIGARSEVATQEKDDPPEEPAGKVQLVQDVGGHTGVITGLTFAPDATRLYTVGQPGEVIEWNVATGRRLRVWRFPGLARRLAISADGRRLVAFINHGQGSMAVWPIDLSSGEGGRGPVFARKLPHHMALAPNGKRVALNFGTATEVYDLDTKAQVGPTYKTGVTNSLVFGPTGRRLLTVTEHATDHSRALQIWNVPGKGKGVGTALPGADRVHALAAWSADGKRVASMDGGGWPTLRVWSVADKKVVWEADVKRVEKLLGNERGQVDAVGLAFISPTEVVACWDKSGQLKVVRFDTAANRTVLLPTAIAHQHGKSGRVAFSADGRWLAATTNPAFRVVLYDLKARKEVRRLGPVADVPRVVAWAAKGYGVAWGYAAKPKQNWRKALARGLSLDTLEPLEPEALDKAVAGGLPPGWRLVRDITNRTYLVRKGKKVLIDLYDTADRPARAFKDAAGKLRLIVVHSSGRHLSIVDPETGKAISRIGYNFNPVSDLALSPDQKYLLVAGGEPALPVFALSRPKYYELSVLPRGHDWIAWTRVGGYYAATPGGERLIGWKVSGAEDRLAAFYPVQRFRKRLYQPDVIRQLLTAGGVKAALKTFKGRSASVAEMLPPVVRIQIKQDAKEKEKFTVEAKADASVKDQPIEALRLLIDGVPVEGKSLEPAQQTASATWTVTVPAGTHELKVLARCPDVSGVSAAREVRVPTTEKDRPALHLLAVGLNEMGDPDLKLKGPKGDAEAIKAEFKKACVGAGNLFGAARSTLELLVDRAATATAVLDKLTEARKKVKPGDLVVLFYAGHGVRKGQEFYLLTHGAKVNDLAKTALSGGKLRDTLGRFPCHVLLLLDACHSGAGPGCCASTGRRPTTRRGSSPTRSAR